MNRDDESEMLTFRGLLVDDPHFTSIHALSDSLFFSSVILLRPWTHCNSHYRLIDERLGYGIVNTTRLVR